ncbi:hypothetical protein CA13_34390 [Planctomycetes bacterium CA13]|uniref:Uncharacterized protein n=1 Tax=Novipirellula herctigrandis TaxID=2527986 RepID=A0A5C5Z3V1_9BACT|nr:hypothetical protein CA13_34390 [Planctomycetes bacterium CA13]
MSNASQSQQTAPPPQQRKSLSEIELPGQNLSLEETLRVMDVARELRNRRETAEEMFRRDDIRSGLRDKLIQTAKVTGDKVTAAEIDMAIDQYLATVNTYEDPKPGMQTFLAHCWVWRDRIAFTAGSIAVVAGGLWFFFA